MSRRIPILYLAPWVHYGGTDTNTIDWFRWLDRDHFAPSLITTQPEGNRRLKEVFPYAEEVWTLPEVMTGERFAPFIRDFVQLRGIELVHVMNARLGFDMLPDLRTMANAPKTVVQLHVEEPDRGGYVRYVTTRYGNLVDAFSVTSDHLAEAVTGYGVARDRVTVIRTGVDAEVEYDPARNTPRSGLEPGVHHILYPGRLTDQKDPLLMVEIAGRLAERRRDFRIHAVGEGHLEPKVRDAIARAGLQDVVLVQPPVSGLHGWLAAADTLLMTSVFEGVPLVAYEAMAMGLPVVLPALPGNRELVTSPEVGVLIDPRDDVDAYVAALARLIEDTAREDMGRAARELMLAEHSIQTMADKHAELYEDLLGRAPARADPAPPAALPERLRLARRPSRGLPPVSMIVPCFNHGRWLTECVESVRAQEYPDLEVIVVDDGSTERETADALEAIERRGDVRVLRMERNSGPSAARNRALAEATGRYVLPVDADNILVAGAVETMVRQLQAAPENVGYIYQSLQYFGNREDYFEPPAFNLDLLMRDNYIDTCALIDREVFDHGIRYGEEVRGDEDWDFFLTLAEHGVVGEPARRRTLLVRKHGFTRSDGVWHEAQRFHPALIGGHPALYGAWGRLKARSAPALSLVSPTPLVRHGTMDADLLIVGLAEQTCQDVEAVCFADAQLPDVVNPPIRCLPLRAARSRAEALVEALRAARGRAVLVTDGALPPVLERPNAVELLLRLLDELGGAVVLADAGGDHFPFQLADEPLDRLQPHAVAWTRRVAGVWPQAPETVELSDVESIVYGLRASGVPLRWHHMPAPRTHGAAVWNGGPATAPLRREPKDAAAEAEEAARLSPAPVADPWSVAPPTDWRPPRTVPLVRYRRPDGGNRVAVQGEPPPGFEFEWELGLVHAGSMAGTKRLAATDGSYALRDVGEPLAPEDADATLGYVEQTVLPLLVPLFRCRSHEAEEDVLVRGDEDPLLGHCGPPLELLGWVDTMPVSPVRLPHRQQSGHFTVGLVRSLDLGERRHRYGAGEVPAGDAAWELGALFEAAPDEGVPVWISPDGSLRTADHGPEGARVQPRTAVRWTGAPAIWRGFGPTGPRARAVVGRSAVAASSLLRGANPTRDFPPDPAGWLSRRWAPDRVGLYAAVHPVTRDQLVTRHRLEATDMGYGEPVLLGYALDATPVTGSGERPEMSIPWGSRFGQAINWAGA